ncbi:MAG: hypothetical protein ACYCT2_06565 [Thermoplasmataceae archaeon]
MTQPENFREKLMETISENPGLHFRELQRRTGSAVGKLDYHLYQLERAGRIFSKKEGGNTRFFSNESGTVSEREIAYYLRIKFGKEVIVGALSGSGYHISTGIPEQKAQIMREMESAGIITVLEDEKEYQVSLRDRDAIVRFLKKYGQSFIDSIALSILNLIDEI